MPNVAPLRAASPEPHIRLPQAVGEAVILSGVNATDLTPTAAADLLKVYVEEGSASQPVRASVQGHYTLVAGSIRFMPLFPFVTGQGYRVEWRSSERADAPPARCSFRIPASTEEASARVVEIAPSAARLPANALRFYLTFSRPLRGLFDRHALRLADSGGQEVTAAFVEFGQELWSADGTRLTLLFDPGRIKRGVTAHRTEGPPLVAGHNYTLSVVLPSRPTFVVRFQAAGPLRTPLAPETWRLTPPQMGTRTPLVLQFDRVMDSALLEDALAVVSASGQPVAGAGVRADGDRKWLFTPVAPWGRGLYRVVFRTDLEDVSGNRIGEALDHEVRSAPTHRSRFERTFRAHTNNRRGEKR